MILPSSSLGVRAKAASFDWGEISSSGINWLSYRSTVMGTDRDGSDDENMPTLSIYAAHYYGGTPTRYGCPEGRALVHTTYVNMSVAIALR